MHYIYCILCVVLWLDAQHRNFMKECRYPPPSNCFWCCHRPRHKNHPQIICILPQICDLWHNRLLVHAWRVLLSNQAINAYCHREKCEFWDVERALVYIPVVGSIYEYAWTYWGINVVYLKAQHNMILADNVQIVMIRRIVDWSWHDRWINLNNNIEVENIVP